MGAGESKADTDSSDSSSEGDNKKKKKKSILKSGGKKENNPNENKSKEKNPKEKNSKETNQKGNQKDKNHGKKNVKRSSETDTDERTSSSRPSKKSSESKEDSKTSRSDRRKGRNVSTETELEYCFPPCVPVRMICCPSSCSSLIRPKPPRLPKCSSSNPPPCILPVRKRSWKKDPCQGPRYFRNTSDPRCYRCCKIVYAAEAKYFDGHCFHHKCFTCGNPLCRRNLDVGQAFTVGNEVFCRYCGPKISNIRTRRSLEVTCCPSRDNTPPLPAIICPPAKKRVCVKCRSKVAETNCYCLCRKCRKRL